jgi:hypothetical protein
MRALEIEVNGRRIAVAASANAVLLSGTISAAVNERGGTLHVSGMEDLGNDVRSHLSWIDMLDVAYADRVTVRFSEVPVGTPPLEESRTDSPEYATRQAEYDEQLRTDPPRPRTVERTQPGVTLRLHWRDEPPVKAILESGREMIMCQFSWNSFRPDRCRVSLSSFSQDEAYGRTGGREWFRGVLNVGEAFGIELDV